MTRRWAISLWLFGTCAVGLAHADTGQSLGSVQAERARIEDLRQKNMAELDVQDAACLSRFAVTDCQSQVGVRRRQMLSEFKAQEAVFNAAERQQKGQVQLHQGKVKEVDNEQRQLRAHTANDYRWQQDRQKAQDIKQRAHQRPPRPVGSKAGALKSDSVVDDKTAEKNQRAYLEKQKALEKRRSERDQRLIDAGKGVAPLPLAP